MTNKERLISLLGFAPGDTNSVDGYLIDAGITGSAAYDGSNITELKTIALSLLYLLLSTADYSNTDGAGFVHSVKYDRIAILKRIDILEGELGLTVGATIQAKSMW